MNLEQILNYRRSVRYYSDTKLIDTEKVKSGSLLKVSTIGTHKFQYAAL